MLQRFTLRHFFQGPGEEAYLVLVDVAIVGGREDGDNLRDSRSFVKHVHFVAVDLSFMSTDDGGKFVVFQKRFYSFHTVDIRALAGGVVAKPLGRGGCRFWTRKNTRERSEQT